MTIKYPILPRQRFFLYKSPKNLGDIFVIQNPLSKKTYTYYIHVNICYCLYPPTQLYLLDDIIAEDNKLKPEGRKLYGKYGPNIKVINYGRKK